MYDSYCSPFTKIQKGVTPCVSSMSSAAIDSHSVVIVGAGLAGLYAAKLLQQRFPDIIVLEATEQPGGRVKQAGLIALPFPSPLLLDRSIVIRYMELLPGQLKLDHSLCTEPIHH